MNARKQKVHASTLTLMKRGFLYLSLQYSRTTKR